MSVYRTLLVACDGSEGSKIAAVHGAILAKKLGGELHALWVRSRLPHYPETIDEVDEEEESAHEFFNQIAVRLQQIGSEQGILIRSGMRAGHPAKTIVEAASELGSDLIVLGNRGHSRLWGTFLGHTADRVSDHAPCSVLIVRSPEQTAHFRKILIGYDGSSGAELALNHSLRLAKQLDSKVHVLWIHETQVRSGDQAEQSKERDWAEEHFKNNLLPRINAAAEKTEIRVEPAFQLGNAAKSIIAEADKGRFRIVALGHRGSSGIWGRFLGGVADRVSDLAHCDVLIVREREKG
jgi:nucleotide-binding universal stress UspA family protein